MAQSHQTPSYFHPPDLEFTSPNQLIYQASFNPSKYLNNLTLFRPEAQLQIREFSSKLESYNSQKLCRKFFSKKVSRIICFREPCSFLNKGKYFSKALKKLTLIQPRQFIQQASPTLKRLSILETDSQVVQMKNLKIRKLTSSSKYLENLFYDQIMHLSFLKAIRRLTNLRVISLVLTDQQILKYGHIISNLKHLEKVKILVRESHLFKTPEKTSKFLTFFKNLLSKNNLQTFEVNLQRSELGRDEECLEELMSTIAQSELQEYNLQIMLEDNSLLDMSKIGSLLQKCDFLGLHCFGRTSIPTLTLPHPLSLKKKRISEAQRKGTQKVFEITFQQIYEPFLFSIVQVYQASSTHKKAMFINLKEMGTSFNILSKFSQLQNFNNLIIDLENLPDKLIKNFSSGLVRALTKATNLENLVLGDSNPWIYTNSAANPSNKPLQDQLCEMKSLKKLHVENLTVNALSWKNLQQILKSLPNLENLYFSLRLKQNHPPASEIKLPFDELINIKKIRLNTAGLTATAGFLLQLTENIQKLEKLKVIEIFGEGFKNTKPDELKNLLKQLQANKNLRKIRLSVSLYFTEITTEIENNLLAELKLEIRELFYQNLNLQELYVYQPQWFEFKYTR